MSSSCEKADGHFYACTIYCTNKEHPHNLVQASMLNLSLH